MSGRGRLGAAFGPAGLREQIGQQMMRHGGPLPLSTVRKLFDDAAEDGDTGEVCQSTAVRQWRKGRLPCTERSSLRFAACSAALAPLVLIMVRVWVLAICALPHSQPRRVIL
jgi:hypothetical protein